MKKRIFFNPQRTEKIKNKKKKQFSVDVLTESTCYSHFKNLMKKAYILPCIMDFYYLCGGMLRLPSVVFEVVGFNFNLI